MKYGSVCSGIEAATHAWHPLGWEASFFSEIEKFPRQVLAHHYPDTPLHGDFTTIQKGDYDPIQLLVGGTPCQSFSVAGLRAGLNDPRGNLMLEFGALAKRLQPKWLVWENVPGVLSSNSGRDFGSFLAMLGELGYGFAYRVLDAQHFGVPQRRRRVFVIGCLSDFGSAAAVLFEQHSLQGHTAESKGKRQEIASTPTRGFGDCGPDLNQIDSGACDFKEVAGTLTRRTGISRNNHEECVAVQTIGALDTECGFQKASHQSINAGHILPIAYREADLANYKPDAASGTLKKSGGCLGGGSESLIIPNVIAPTLTAANDPFRSTQSSEVTNQIYSVIQATSQVANAVAFNWQGSAQQGDSVSEKITPTLDKSKVPAVAHAFKVRGGCEGGGKGYLGQDEQAFTLSTGADQQLFHKMQVRRLMPIECERLQGFRDDFTNIPGASDSTRYKALGNSMAVPVMAWIGKRIDMIEKMQKELK
jgi:DNA (cytosine-5)-methyltransferase 1